MASPLTSQPYLHSPLSTPHTFRLIELQPSNSHDDPLLCSILETKILTNVTESRAHEHKYEALSYVWGAPTGSRPLLIGNGILSITPNCESALRYLRYAHQPRRLFVDAICIDQSLERQSEIERNGQVKLMGEIYSRASGTIIWLGEGDEHTSSVFGYLAHSTGWVSMNRILPRRWERAIWPSIWPSYGSVQAVLTNAWFSRLWTIQELALSPEKCTVVCGGTSMPWERFSDAACQWAEASYGVGRGALSHELSPFYNQYLIRSVIQNPGKRIPYSMEQYQSSVAIISVLNCSREHHSSKSLDKIYGVYSILQQLGLILHDPDYMISIETLCEEVTIALILQEGSLLALDSLRSLTRMESLPSWVPDWTSPFLYGSQIRRDISFQAHTKANIGLVNGRNLHQLPVTGTLISKIDTCGEGGLRDAVLDHVEFKYRFKTIPLHTLEQKIAEARCLRAWFNFARKQVACPTEGGAMEALFQNLIAYHKTSEIWDNTVGSGGRPRALDNQRDRSREVIGARRYLFDKWGRWAATEKNVKPKSWSRFVERFSDQCRERLEKVKEDPDIKFWYKTVWEGDNLRLNYAQFRIEVLHRLYMRNIFTMESGHIGIGPSQLQHGDLVVLLLGAVSPMILRPRGVFFELLGPAVIHGLMGGRVLERKYSELANPWGSARSIVQKGEYPNDIWLNADSQLKEFILV